MVDSIKKYVDLIAAIVTILGIVFAIWQYYEIKSDGRINATLGYVAKFESTPFAEATDKIDSKWQSEAGVHLRYNPGPDWPDRQKQFIEDNNIGRETLLVANFMDELYICIQKRICSIELAITLLGRDVENVYTRSHYYLSSYTGRMGGDTGCGLAALYSTSHAYLQALREKKPLSPLTINEHACPLTTP